MYLSTAQACAKLGISRWVLMNLIRSGEIEGAIKGKAKNSHLRIPEASVTAYIARQTVTSGTADRAAAAR